MTAPNGKSPQAQAIPLLAILPEGAHAPQFQLMAQWHTGTGILCPVHNVPVQLLAPPMIIQMFIGLVNSGVVGQVVVAEDGSQSIENLPSMQLTMREPPAAAQVPPPPSTEDLEKKWGRGV